MYPEFSPNFNKFNIAKISRRGEFQLPQEYARLLKVFPKLPIQQQKHVLRQVQRFYWEQRGIKRG